MVLLEGFAAGCPIIASDAPGLQGLVNHGENGWVVPRENTNALAEMLGAIWNNPSMNTYVAQNGLQVARNCEWSRIAERHVMLFEQLTGQRQQFTLRLTA